MKRYKKCCDEITFDFLFAVYKSLIHIKQTYSILNNYKQF